MLPDRFYWTPWTPGTVALKLDEHLVGLVVGGCAGGGCRVERNIGTLHMRYEFFSHPDIGMRFLEAWARRWEARIREQYGSLSRGDYGPPRAPDAPPIQQPPAQGQEPAGAVGSFRPLAGVYPDCASAP